MVSLMDLFSLLLQQGVNQVPNIYEYVIYNMGYHYIS